jgi:hypothetical protein
MDMADSKDSEAEPNEDELRLPAVESRRFHRPRIES